MTKRGACSMVELIKIEKDTKRPYEIERLDCDGDWAKTGWSGWVDVYDSAQQELPAPKYNKKGIRILIMNNVGVNIYREVKNDG